MNGITSPKENPMTLSPARPFPFETAQGFLRIWGGDGEAGQGAEQQPDSGAAGGQPADADGGQDDVQSRIQELEQKAAENEKKAKDAEKRAKDFEKQLNDKNLENLDEAERTAAERDDFKAKYEQLLEFVETSVVETAIMKNSKYQWHDVEAVRAFLDKDQIKLDLDNKTVDGLDSQLADLAKKKPYLLKQPEPQQQQDHRPPPGPSTGLNPSGGSQRSRETDKGKLAKKFKFDHLVVGGSPR
jgi:hypothetical protein